MPSKSKAVTLRCPECPQSFPYIHWLKISGDDCPDLKEKILAGSLFKATCPHCGCLQHIVANLRYSDYGTKKNYFVYLTSQDMAEEERPFIEAMASLKSNGIRLHLAYTVQEIQSIIRTYDDGLQYPETHIFPSVQALKQSKQIREGLDEVMTQMKSASKPSIWKRLFG